MSRKRNGVDVIKKIIPMLIDSPPATKEYHRNYQRLNRHLEKEARKRSNPSIRTLEKQAERLFKDMEKVLSRKKPV